MATITGASTTGQSTQNQAALDFRATPETYTTLDTLIKTTKDFVMPELVETYGNQGITGFLELTGAVQSGGTSDQIDWYEVGRRHRVLNYTLGNTSDTGGGVSVTCTDTEIVNNVQLNDVLMEVDTGSRFIVQSGGSGTGTAVSPVILVPLDGGTFGATDIVVSTDGSFIKLGNMYAQGSEQPGAYNETDVHKRSNPFMIVKGRHEVNGSQATNVGWVNLGGGEYRWFMYAEQEARKRFEDQREMMLLFGERYLSSGGGTDLAEDLAGSDGYFTQVENFGINVTGANSNPIDSFAEIDDIILELDKVGAPAEYAMYLNRKQDLAMDDMLASGIATSVTAGLPGQFGAFQNNADMAVQLGFKSFTRGGYTFHKHDWKLLNDPTLLGASTVYQGAMVPLANVADPRTGNKAPSLAMYYKEANGYSRQLEHWVTGGGVLGYNNNGDAGRDQAVFHYRSECNLIVRAANQHVVIKG